MRSVVSLSVRFPLERACRVRGPVGDEEQRVTQHLGLISNWISPREPVNTAEYFACRHFEISPKLMELKFCPVCNRDMLLWQRGSPGIAGNIVFK